MAPKIPEPQITLPDVVLIDEPIAEASLLWVSGCESCSDEAAIPFEYILEHIKGAVKHMAWYILFAPLPCPICGKGIVEKTLVAVHPKAPTH